MIVQRVYQGLAALGKTDEEVVASLVAAGHRGKRWDGENCVFAKYIKGIFFPGEVIWVCVDTHVVKVYTPTWENTMVTPPNIALLIDDFDTGLYPQLVKD